MQISYTLQQAIAKAIIVSYQEEMAPEKLVIRPSPKAFSGSHALVIIPIAKRLGRPITQVGETLGAYLVTQTTWVASYEVVGGFLNLALTDSCWEKAWQVAQKAWQEAPKPTGQQVVLEFSCPNTNKPLHLGHLRNNFLGDALARLLQAVGHQVYKVNLINDRGIHICKSMVAYERMGKERTPSQEGVKGDHFVGRYYVAFNTLYQQEQKALIAQGKSPEEASQEAPIMQAARQALRAWEARDEATRRRWKRMNSWVLEGFQASYARMGISFDQVYYESQTYLQGKELVQEGLKKGVFYRKVDGSVWSELRTEPLEEKLVLRGDGTSVYITQDMGTIEARYQAYTFDQHLYVVGHEQEYHFSTLFTLLKQLDRPYARALKHLSYGAVCLSSGRMKSREGKVVHADDLMDELLERVAVQSKTLGKAEEQPEQDKQALYALLSLGALKYFLLKVSPRKEMVFDPATSIDLQGETALFIQYTHARICTLLAKATQEATQGKDQEAPLPALEPLERTLISWLIAYQEQVAQAARQYNPSLLTHYLYHLAKAFNAFYAELPIRKAPMPALAKRRLALARSVALVINKGMSLLGIQVPERM